MTLHFQINYDVLALITVGYILFFVSLYVIIAFIRLTKKASS